MHQGARDKLAVFTRLCARLRVPMSSCACVGDDVPDLPLMRHVALSFAVADAHASVRRAADVVTRLPGGHGAVREVCDRLHRAQRARGGRAMSYRIVALLAFVALIIAFVTLTGGQREDAAPVAQGPLPDPGYSALQAHMVQTGPDGLPLYTLNAARVQQQPDQGTINLEQVQLGFRDEQRQHLDRARRER